MTGVLAVDDPPDADRDAERTITAAIDEAAAHLRNTRAVCRQSYVHPAVLESYRDGLLHEDWSRSRPGRHVDRADRTLLRTLSRGRA